MNPAKLLQFKREWERFTQRHPKLMRYLSVVSRTHMKEGVIVELSVREPDGNPLHANLRLTSEDVALLQSVKELLQKES